jgi:hypothetical protein
MKHTEFQKHVHNAYPPSYWYYADMCVLFYKLDIIEESPNVDSLIEDVIACEHKEYIKEYIDEMV